MNTPSDSQQSLRILVIIVGVVLANFVCTVRLSSLSLSTKDKVVSNNKEQPIFFKERVDIVDRNHVPIATNLNTFSMYADPKMVMEPQITSQHLSLALEGKVDDKVIYDSITSENKRFVWLKRNLSPDDFVKVNELGRPGIFFLREEKRIYPQGNLLAHILGHVDTDGHGVSGMELYFDKELSSKEYQQSQPLISSIDVRIQHAVRSALLKQVANYNASGAAAVVMDVKTGEMLSLVSVPDFDPNNMNDTAEEALFNRASLGVYEIGSIFKTFIVSLALEEGAVDLEEEFDVSTPIKIGRTHYVTDLYPIASGKADLETIFKKSSNIGMVQISMRLGGEKIAQYLTKMGFDAPTSIELPERSMPLHPKKWTDAEVATISYGYGVAATIIHVAETMAITVNGTRTKATLIKTSKNDEGTPGDPIISETTSSIMRRLLRRAVSSGTGRKAEVKGYCVGGKTGTSNKIVNGKYDTSNTVTSFAAVFPIYDPKYLVVVMIDNPKHEDSKKMTGGLVAAPVAGEIVGITGSILNLTTDDQLCSLYE